MSSIKPIILNSSNITAGNNNVMTLNFPQRMMVADDEEVALGSCFIPYSWPNITTTLNNTSFSYTWPSTGATKYNVDMIGTNPSGVYFMIADINNYLKGIMKLNGHYLVDSNGVN